LETTDRASRFSSKVLAGKEGPAKQARTLTGARESWVKIRKDEALIAQTILAVYAYDNMEVET
jgi:hypothetical protein